MKNLFSVFDPTSVLNLSLNWGSLFLFLLLIPSGFWLSLTPFKYILNHFLLTLNKEFKMLFEGPNNLSVVFPMLSLFLLIVMNNFLGLFPFVFTTSAHLTFTLSLSLPLWLGIWTIGWVYTTQKMLAHLTPLSSPLMLGPFMVVIELISSIIRPITLSVRLAANMVAGHLLMAIVSIFSSSSSFFLMVLLMLSLLALGFLEMGVAIIQAYVFSVLSTIYVSEINDKSFHKQN